MSSKVEEAISYAGSSLITLNCIVSGLTSQLKAAQGTAGVEAAKAYALQVAKEYPTAGTVKPDHDAIAEFFNGHK
ncbi:hypothetical protein [Pseudomonas viridiflava]|uniref:hypothetical protein n=1 Tax=Pseudomonas viridiflava TaxID=33069 RepID=UPI002B1E728B|nr:hypothetical protein [Pseudomonas viridiflava]